VFFNKFDFDPYPEMDPEPDPDPELSEKSDPEPDPDPEIIFSAPTHWVPVRIRPGMEGADYIGKHE